MSSVASEGLRPPPRPPDHGSASKHRWGHMPQIPYRLALLSCHPKAITDILDMACMSRKFEESSFTHSRNMNEDPKRKNRRDLR